VSIQSTEKDSANDRQPITYGRARPTQSSSSLIFDLTPPTSPLITPHASSDNIDAPSFNLSDKENVSPVKTKQPTQVTLGSFFNLPNKKRPLSSTKSDSKVIKKPKEDDRFRQMHLTHLPLIHTCPQCQMSYIRGGDDEGTHEKHHARVTRGIIWDGLGRGNRVKSKVDGDKGWRVIKDNVPFNGKGRGRVLVADGSFGGVKVCPLKTRDRGTRLIAVGRYPKNDRHCPLISTTPTVDPGSMQDLPIHHNVPATRSTKSHSERHTQRTSRFSRSLPTDKMGYESPKAKRGERGSGRRFRRRGSMRVRPSPTLCSDTDKQINTPNHPFGNSQTFHYPNLPLYRSRQIIIRRRM
jgi:hypothetical protein